MRKCPSCSAVSDVTREERLFPDGWTCARCGWTPRVLHDVPLLAPELADTLDGFDPEAFSVLAAIEDRSFWFTPRNRLLLGLAGKFFNSARTYMEVGCGTGFVLRDFARQPTWERLIGSELHPRGLEVARRRIPSGVEFLQMDARAIPLVGELDLVGAYDVLEHIREDVEVLRQLHAALKRGGGMLLTVPQHPWLWSPTDHIAHHVRRYARGELERKVREAGFEILFTTSYTAALLPLMVASRLALRSRSRKAATTTQAILEAELVPGRAVNAALRACLEAEVRLSLKGIRWPAGGSRVVVAQKV